MKRFGLLGEKLTHSFSPQIHARLADYEYKLYEIAPNEVGDFLRSGAFDGLNVTIPYKKTVIPFCAGFSESAKKIGSVNTIIRRADKTLYGDNTDYFGFLYMLGKNRRRGIGQKSPDTRERRSLAGGQGGSRGFRCFGDHRNIAGRRK